MTDEEKEVPEYNSVIKRVGGKLHTIKVFQRCSQVGPEEAVREAFERLSEKYLKVLIEEPGNRILTALDQNWRSRLDTGEWGRLEVDENGWRWNPKKILEPLMQDYNVQLKIPEKYWADDRSVISSPRMNVRQENDHLNDQAYCVQVLKFMRLAYDLYDTYDSHRERREEHKAVVADDHNKMAVMEWLDAQGLMAGYPHCNLGDR